MVRGPPQEDAALCSKAPMRDIAPQHKSVRSCKLQVGPLGRRRHIDCEGHSKHCLAFVLEIVSFVPVSFSFYWVDSLR